MPVAFFQSAPWVTPVIILAVGLLIAWQARRHLRVAVIGLQLFLLFVGFWGAFRLEVRQGEIETTQTQLEHERSVRSRVQGEINRYVCSENNKQDEILAGLIEVSVKGQGRFGEGIDRSQLSVFDMGVLEAINRVQALTEENQDQLKAVFEKALHQLRDETPCTTVVRAFLAASTTDDLKAIRRILREASDDRLKAPQQRHGHRKQRP